MKPPTSRENTAVLLSWINMGGVVAVGGWVGEMGCVLVDTANIAQPLHIPTFTLLLLERNPKTDSIVFQWFVLCWFIWDPIHIRLV